jgi:hypothetical protein
VQERDTETSSRKDKKERKRRLSEDSRDRGRKKKVKTTSGKGKAKTRSRKTSSSSTSANADSSMAEQVTSDEEPTKSSPTVEDREHLTPEELKIELALDRKFAMLNDIWAQEDRPANLQTREDIRDYSMELLIAYKADYKKEQEARGSGTLQFGRDNKLKPKHYPAMTDDGERKFHPARFDRLPTVEPVKYMKKWSIKREPIYRHIPLRHYGIEGQVVESTVVRMHNRGTPVQLEHLCREKVSLILFFLQRKYITLFVNT